MGALRTSSAEARDHLIIDFSAQVYTLTHTYTLPLRIGFY